MPGARADAIFRLYSINWEHEPARRGPSAGMRKTLKPGMH